MSKPASDRAAAPLPGRGRNDESIRLVCGGLVLAVVVLALRIANVWP